jgi:hypothetical protein
MLNAVALSAAMGGLERLTENIVTERLKAYGDGTAPRLFDAPDEAWRDLSRTAMGVPRTLGIVLKQAWSRSTSSKRAVVENLDLESEKVILAMGYVALHVRILTKCLAQRGVL